MNSPGEGLDSDFVVSVRGLTLLAAEAFSIGLGLGLAGLGAVAMARFVAGNAISSVARASLLLACGACLLAGLLLWGLIRTRRGSAVAWDTARRLAPWLLAAALPPLFNWRAWEGRDLHFLVLSAAFVLALFRLVRVAQSAPALGLGSRFSTSGPFLRLPGRILARPGLLIGLAVLGYALYFGYHTIVHHRNGFSRSFDLGIENNGLWNIVHGAPLLKNTPSAGPQGNMFGSHATLLAYVLAPVYALHQSPETLLALQALLVGAAAIPFFLWSRVHLGPTPAVVLSLCYLLYPPLHGANLFDFHYLTIAPFFLWLALWALETRRDRIGTVAVLLCLALREDVAASLAVLGLYLLFSGRRPVAGAVVAGVSNASFAALKFVLMPLAEPDPTYLFQWAGLLPSGERSYFGVLKTIVANPVFTLGTLLTLPKLVYMLQILVPLAFLPLRRPLGWLFLLPGLVFTLLSTGYPPLTQISFQYTAHWTGFLFPAVVLVLGQASRAGPPRAAALAALVAGTLVVSHQYGAVLQRNTARGGFDRFHFGTTDADLALRRERAALLARVPERAKVVASETLVPHVSSRPDAYTLRLGVYDAEYMLFSLIPTATGEIEQARAALADGRFGVVAVESRLVLARRGYDLSGNPPVLDFLSRLHRVETPD